MNPIILIGISFGYFLALVFYFISFESQKGSAGEWAKRIVVFSLLAHLALVLWAFTYEGFAIRTLSEYLSVASFFMLFACFSIEHHYKVKFLMLFALPVVLLFCFLSALLENREQAVRMTQDSGWLWFHVGLILSAFTCFVVSFSSAVMYLIQSRQLKSRHPSRIFLKLPSLEALDKLHLYSSFVGVLLFSSGILSGLFWATEIKEFLGILKDTKVIFSLISCVLYWALLLLRFSSMRRGQKIAMGTVVVFAVLFLTIMTSFYAPSNFHGVNGVM